MSSISFIQTFSTSVWNRLKQSIVSSIWLKGVVSIAAIYVVNDLYYYAKRKYYHYPPGPNGIPFFGSLLSAIKIRKLASYLASNYGSVTMVYIGKQPFVFLHSISSINQVLKHDNALDRDFETSLATADIKPADMSVTLANEKYWPTKRKHFQSIILAALDSTFLNRVHNRSLECHVFKSIDNTVNNQNSIWNFSKDIQYIQFHFIWHACFGSFLDYNSREQTQCIGYMFETFQKVAIDIALRYMRIDKLLPASVRATIFVPLLERFGSFLEQSIYKHTDYDETVFQFDEQTRNKWKLHFDQVKDDPQSTAIARLLAQYHSNPGVTRGQNPKQSILESLKTFFLAGFETTFHTTEYGLVLLAKFPDVQQQVYQELVSVFGDDWRMQNVQLGKVISELHVLRAFIHELLRISSVVSLGVAHYNRKGAITLTAKTNAGRGYRCCIPKGSVIFADIGHANLNDSYWVRKCGGNPMDVCLAAWLDDRKRFKINFNKDRMLTFSVGKRDCAGRALALRGLYLVFAKFILNYQFALPDGNTDVGIQQNFEMSMVMTPKIPLKVTKR